MSVPLAFSDVELLQLFQKSNTIASPTLYDLFLTFYTILATADSTLKQLIDWVIFLKSTVAHPSLA